MIGVFIPRESRHHHRVDVLEAFAAGLRQCEVYSSFNGYKPCDVMVIYGWRKNSASGRANIALLEAHQGPVVCVEKGFVRRDDYYMVGLDGLNGRADFRNALSPPDRWDALGVELRPFLAEDGPVVVCGQRANDASVYGTNHVRWCRDVCEQLSERHIVVFRSHPVDLEKGKAFHVPGVANEQFPIDRARAVVTFNSNSAVEAVMKGVPAVATDRGSMAWRVSANVPTTELFYQPDEEDRLQWCRDLAYCQWTVEEMAAGLPQRHLGLT